MDKWKQKPKDTRCVEFLNLELYQLNCFTRPSTLLLDFAKHTTKHTFAKTAVAPTYLVDNFAAVAEFPAQVACSRYQNPRPCFSCTTSFWTFQASSTVELDIDHLGIVTKLDRRPNHTFYTCHIFATFLWLKIWIIKFKSI